MKADGGEVLPRVPPTGGNREGGGGGGGAGSERGLLRVIFFLYLALYLLLSAYKESREMRLTWTK